ncbi:MAG: polysaccharide deacetylase family protein [Acidobacteriota bacterium]|nr:polysaccharide deacetylase family protein [Acidobacteriota bacterium]
MTFGGSGLQGMRKLYDMNPVPAVEAVCGACGTGAFLSWASVAPASQLFGPTIRRTGNASTMAITFDDGPNPAVTPALLDLLEKYRARATFFLIGRNVRRFPELTREIAARGHTIGNHTETHPSLAFMHPRRIADQLTRCDEAIESVIGKRPRWMRPPFGFRGPQLNGVVRQRDPLGVVMWSVLAWDWKPQPAAPVIRRLGRARGGDIVLLHDGDHRVLEGDRRHSVDALAHWLPRWSDRGLRFVNLDEVRAAA